MTTREEINSLILIHQFAILVNRNSPSTSSLRRLCSSLPYIWCTHRLNLPFSFLTPSSFFSFLDAYIYFLFYNLSLSGLHHFSCYRTYSSISSRSTFSPCIKFHLLLLLYAAFLPSRLNLSPNYDQCDANLNYNHWHALDQTSELQDVAYRQSESVSK